MSSLSKLSTIEIIDFITDHKGTVLEISMNKDCFRATHIVYFGGRRIFDMGIDSQTVSWSPKEFIDFYSQAYWTIEQVTS